MINPCFIQFTGMELAETRHWWLWRLKDCLACSAASVWQLLQWSVNTCCQWLPTSQAACATHRSYQEAVEALYSVVFRCLTSSFSSYERGSQVFGQFPSEAPSGDSNWQPLFPLCCASSLFPTLVHMDKINRRSEVETVPEWEGHSSESSSLFSSC